MQPREKAVSKREFDKSINYCTKVRRKESSFFITRAKYNHLLNQVKAARKKKQDELHPRLARLVKRYDVIKSDGVERLAVPNSTNQLIYISKDELYNVISQVHIATDHGSLHEMTKCLKSTYKNVASDAIVAYLKLCQKCKKCPKQGRGAKKKESLASKEEDELKENKETKENKRTANTNEKQLKGKRKSVKIDSKEKAQVSVKIPKSVRRARAASESGSTKPLTYGTRTLQKIDFIEMVSNGECEYNYIVVLRESTTKFVHLRPLASRSPRELADILFSIFFCFGSPSTLLSSNSEFIQSSLEVLYSKYPTTPNDVVVEATEEGQFLSDIETLTLSWVCEKNESRWYNALRFVQYIVNLMFNAEIGKTPFEAMFGRKGKLDLNSVNLPAELMGGIRVADDPDEEVKDVEINEMLEVLMNDDD